MNDTCPRLDQQASPHLDGTVEQAWRSRGTKSSLARDEHILCTVFSVLFLSIPRIIISTMSIVSLSCYSRGCRTKGKNDQMIGQLPRERESRVKDPEDPLSPRGSLGRRMALRRQREGRRGGLIACVDQVVRGWDRNWSSTETGVWIKL
jgi:hypothetical protein